MRQHVFTAIAKRKTARFATLLLPVTLLACADAQAPESPTAVAPSAGVFANDPGGNDALLQAVRQATARFNSTAQAAAAGYAETDHCVPAMGYHWVNNSLVDPVFDPSKPEVMLYAAGENGKPKLVAVEYIVINVGQPRPTFNGHPFDIGGTPVPVPHWSLHVWLYANNPDGQLTAFNPSMACQQH